VILGLVVAIVLVTGCGESVKAPSSLAGTKWALISLNGRDLIEGTEVLLYFEKEFLGGTMTCNGYGGTPDTGSYLAADDGVFALPHLLAVTVQLCSTPEGVMEQESAYIDALLSAVAHEMSGDRLEISNAAGETMLVYVSYEGD
jgi:heat shock protein HslJ